MKKQTKPAGLIDSVTAETSTQRAQREAKRSFIDSWKRKHPEIGRELRELSKADLIKMYVRRIAGDAYDIAFSMGSGPALGEFLDAAMIANLSDTLLRGTPDEARAAVKEWEARSIAAAGGDVTKVAEIARAAGATLARIDLNRFKKGLSQEGRINGGRTMKAKPLALIAHIRESVESILNNPARSGMSDGEIATFLMAPSRSIHKFQREEYSRKTMMRRIAEIREAFGNRNGQAG